MRNFLKKNEIFLTAFNSVVIAVIAIGLGFATYFLNRSQHNIMLRQTGIMESQAEISRIQLLRNEFLNTPRLTHSSIEQENLKFRFEVSNVESYVSDIDIYNYLVYEIRNKDNVSINCFVPYLNESQSSATIENTGDTWIAELDLPAIIIDGPRRHGIFEFSDDQFSLHPMLYVFYVAVEYYDYTGSTRTSFYRVSESGEIRPDIFAGQIITMSWSFWSNDTEIDTTMMDLGYEASPAVPYIRGGLLTPIEAERILNSRQCVNVVGQLEEIPN